MPKHLLTLPRLRVQNANCISSPMTWGFPAITAFTGFMVALQRRLMQKAGDEANALAASLRFESVGVICHRFEPQVSKTRFETYFALKRQMIRTKKDLQEFNNGSPPAFVEEGRAYLDISLVFTVYTAQGYVSDEDAQAAAQAVAAEVAGMRLAGGSIMPPLQKLRAPQRTPRIDALKAAPEDQLKQFKQLRRRLLPGFALVSRDDVLQQRLQTLQDAHAAQASTTSASAAPTLLDAWLDLSRINHRAQLDEATGQVTWKQDARPGWLVPMPVGFAILSSYEAGTVANARDAHTPFRFVESVYSIGQWVSPHRLADADAFMWQPQHDPELGLYRCVNRYRAPDDEAESDAESAEADMAPERAEVENDTPSSNPNQLDFD